MSSPTDKVPSSAITPEDQAAFEVALADYHPRESDPDDERDRKTKYVPVWLDDKVAHGHYDGYCKQSKFVPMTLCWVYFWILNVPWILFASFVAAVPLSALAGRCY